MEFAYYLPLVGILNPVNERLRGRFLRFPIQIRENKFLSFHRFFQDRVRFNWKTDSSNFHLSRSVNLSCWVWEILFSNFSKIKISRSFYHTSIMIIVFYGIQENTLNDICNALERFFFQDVWIARFALFRVYGDWKWDRRGEFRKVCTRVLLAKWLNSHPFNLLTSRDIPIWDINFCIGCGEGWRGELRESEGKHGSQILSRYILVCITFGGNF